jgi:dUTP pyrophosphatase
MHRISKIQNSNSLKPVSVLYNSSMTAVVTLDQTLRNTRSPAEPLLVKIKFDGPNRDYARIPTRATPQSAGYDLYAALERETVVRAGKTGVIPTGIFLEFPDGWEAQIRGRSGLALKGITVPNSPGTIDADYRGEIKVLLHNSSDEDFTLAPGQRIAQLCFNQFQVVNLVQTDELSDSVRGEGGFGSTGL